MDIKQYYYKYKALKYYLKNDSISQYKIKGGSENKLDKDKVQEGTLLYKNGNKYKGKLKSVRHGEGKLYRTDGTIRYKGEYKDDKKHGKGTLLYKNGDIGYEGEWENDLPHGQGTYYFNNEPYKGDRYEGEWKDGKQHGQGTYYWNDGDRYEGEFKDGLKHGQGIYYSNNGDRYEGIKGQWENDKII